MFALRNVYRPEGAQEQGIGDKIPEQRLREYGRQMFEFARENEAKSAVQTGVVQPSEPTAGHLAGRERGREEVLGLGLKVVSISGAKGKRLIGAQGSINFFVCGPVFF
jgi:hypothetical protein